MAAPRVEISVDMFKQIAFAVREATGAYWRELNVEEAYDLLAVTLTNESWPQFRPLLPKAVEIGTNDQRKNLDYWLYSRGIATDASTLDRLYDTVCQKVSEPYLSADFSEWRYLDDLEKLERKAKPLYFRDGINVHPAYIVIVPDHRTIYAETGIRGAATKYRCLGHEYEVHVRADVSGSELVRIMRAPTFVQLITDIADDHTVEYTGRGRDWKGVLGERGRQALRKLRAWFDRQEHFQPGLYET